MARRFFSSESYIMPTILAVLVYILILSGFFMVWSTEPTIPEVTKPTMMAKLYQLNSQSMATTQSSNKIAGDQAKTTAPLSKDDQMATQKQDAKDKAEAKKIADEKAAQLRKQQEEAKKIANEKAAKLKKQQEEAKKIADQKAAKLKKQQEEAKAKKIADEKAAKLKKQQEEAKAKKIADEKAAKLKKQQEEAAARKAKEAKEAQALAELLNDKTGHATTKGDQLGNQIAGSYDDLIGTLVRDNWVELGNPVKGTTVQLLIEMIPDGTITNVKVYRSSGNIEFDNSAVTAVKTVGRVPEIQRLDTATFNKLYRQRVFEFRTKGL